VENREDQLKNMISAGQAAKRIKGSDEWRVYIEPLIERKKAAMLGQAFSFKGKPQDYENHVAKWEAFLEFLSIFDVLAQQGDIALRELEELDEL
jgi:hypothetical protein